MSIPNPWLSGPEFDGWDPDDPVSRLAEVEAEDVIRGLLPRENLLPPTDLILDARDARLAGAAAREPEPEAEL